MQAYNETWQAHNKTMQALRNKTLAALDNNTNTSKIPGHHQQSSFLDERAALLTHSSDPPVTLKTNGGKTFAVKNVMIDILMKMGKQTNKQFQLISIDPNLNIIKKGVDVSLVPDGIKMKT